MVINYFLICKILPLNNPNNIQVEEFLRNTFIFYFIRNEIDVEGMEMDCKKFVKDIRGLDKEMRAWDAFNGLDGTVKNMMTSLRAVGELQNPAIRERHWDQLMQATKVRKYMAYILLAILMTETINPLTVESLFKKSVFHQCNKHFCFLLR